MSTDNTTEPTRRSLFDVRLMISAILGVYGVILTIMGATASDAALRKADGIRINLWVGLSMLVVAAAFLAWAYLRPLAQDTGDPDDDGSA